LKAKAMPSPIQATTRPATAGPTLRAALKIEELSAIAFSKSSRPTISTVNDWRAGASKALATPSRKASTNTCQTCTRPVSVSRARIAASTIAATWVASSSRRLETRSTTVPAGSESSSTGAELAAAARPSSAGESVRRSTSQPWATLCIQVPVSEISWPAKNRR
jgi:hypothetical protein